jgi:hypothetical protein
MKGVVMMSLEDRHLKLDKLRDFAREAETAIQPFAESQLDIPCGAGEWTVRQVVHHLADAHMNGYIRMKLVLTENRPILKPYDQDAWISLDDMRSSTALSLSILNGLHDRWYRLLAGLPEDSWQRAGIHLENGLVSLDSLLSLYVGHGEEHLDQIRRLRRSLGIDPD